MLKKIIRAFFIVMLFASCTSFRDEDLTVINNLKLGSDRDKLYESFERLGIKREEFNLKPISSRDEIPVKKETYYTELFDLTQYANPNARRPKHIGMIVPLVNQGTNAVTGLVVLPASTGVVIDMNTLTETGERTISQNINIMLVGDIEGLLVKKYGSPKKRKVLPDDDVYVIEEGDLREYRMGGSVKGEVLVWETKAFEVLYFKGTSSPDTYFDTNIPEYWTSFVGEDKMNEEVEQADNKIGCMLAPYIRYSLKQNVIDKLQLDEPAL